MEKRKYNFVANIETNYNTNLTKYDISKNKLYLQFNLKAFPPKHIAYLYLPKDFCSSKIWLRISELVEITSFGDTYTKMTLFWQNYSKASHIYE